MLTYCYMLAQSVLRLILNPVWIFSSHDFVVKEIQDDVHIERSVGGVRAGLLISGTDWWSEMSRIFFYTGVTFLKMICEGRLSLTCMSNWTPVLSISPLEGRTEQGLLGEIQHQIHSVQILRKILLFFQAIKCFRLKYSVLFQLNLV